MRSLGLLLAGALSLPGTAFAAADFVIDAQGGAFADSTPAVAVGGNTATTLGAQRLAAVKYAARIWAKLLDSQVPITVRVRFDDLTCGDDGQLTLAQTHAADLVQLGAQTPDGVPENVWYPIALADRILGVDLKPGVPDIELEINSAVDRGCADSEGWYYGFDGKATDRNDLVDTLIHELAHGLGFSSYISSQTGALLPRTPDVFTHHLVHAPSGRKLADLSNGERLLALQTPRTIVWSGREVQKEATQWLRPGSIHLTLDPPVAGFSSWVGEAGMGAVPNNLRVRGRLMFVPGRTACSQNIDATSAIVLVEAGHCERFVLLDRLRRAGAAGVLIAVPSFAGSNPYSFPEHPTMSLSIPVLTVSAMDAERIVTRLQTQSMQASFEANPSQLSGADAMGRPFVFSNSPADPGSNLSHFDTLPRPDLLMEPYARDKTTHAVDLTRAILMDIGWTITCGNSTLDPGEDCDEGAGNSDAPGGTCRTTCRMASCGDGIIVEGEECDDGTENSDVTPNSCRTMCREPRCGDHVIDEGEVCDGDADCSDSCRSRSSTTAKIPVWESDGMTIKQQAQKDGGCSCNLAGRRQSGNLTSLLFLTAVASLLAQRRRRSTRRSP